MNSLHLHTDLLNCRKLGKTVEAYKNFNEVVSSFITKHCQELDTVSFFENVHEIEL